MTLDFMKDQRKTKDNLCIIQKVEVTMSKQHPASSFGITDEQLILNLVPRLSKHIIEVPPLNWFPTMEQL